MLMVPRVRSSFIVVAVAALLAGIALLVYARWSEPASKAAQAVAAGDTETALTTYSENHESYKKLPLVQRLLPSDYAMVAHNRLALLYQLEKYDDLIDASVDAPPAAAPHFWAGCAFFKKAMREKKQEAQLEWFTRAEDEFKLALGTAPDDWDTKFNYELSVRIARALRPSAKDGREQKSVPSSLMNLLRPQQQQQQQRPVKKVG